MIDNKLRQKLIHIVMELAYEEGRDQGKAEAVNVLMRMKLDAQKTPYCGLKAEELLDKAMEEIQNARH